MDLLVPDGPGARLTCQAVVEYGGRRALVVGAVMLATLMQLADTTIVNVALPTMDGELGASIDEGAWFITAYIIANVIVIPLSPWLQTMVGRKNYFALSIAGFHRRPSVASAASSDRHLTTEIALRLSMQGAGSTARRPAWCRREQIIRRHVFRPTKLATSQSLFALALILGPTIGPTLGGILTDQLTWRWIFFINLVPGIAATVLALVFIRDPAAPKRVPFDVFGIALLAAGLGCLQYVLDEGQRNGWFGDAHITLTAIAALVLLVAFVVWELFGARTPGVALRTFRHRTVWALAVTYFAVAAGIFALIFIQPAWAQQSLGFTTTLAGLLLMVRAGTLVVLYPFTTWVTSRASIGTCVGSRLAGSFLAFGDRDLAANRDHDDPNAVLGADLHPGSRRRRLRVHLRAAQRDAVQDRPGARHPRGACSHTALTTDRCVGRLGLRRDLARARLRSAR